MKNKPSGIHVATVNKKYKDKVYKCHLLRRSYREDGKVKSETIANLSMLPDEVLAVLKLSLAGENMIPARDISKAISTLPCGHVRAVLGVMQKLGIPELLASRESCQRNLVLGMIAERVLSPSSKLGTVRSWTSSTLGAELGIEDADADELYAALDWLLAAQPRIEKKLADRHLSEGGLALYDTSNSMYEGHTCPLAQIGHDKDGRRGASIIGYGLLTDREGRPVAMEVYPGNVADPVTVTERHPRQRHRGRQQEASLRFVRCGQFDRPDETSVARRRYPGGWIPPQPYPPKSWAMQRPCARHWPSSARLVLRAVHFRQSTVAATPRLLRFTGWYETTSRNFWPKPDAGTTRARGIRRSWSTSSRATLPAGCSSTDSPVYGVPRAGPSDWWPSPARVAYARLAGPAGLQTPPRTSWTGSCPRPATGSGYSRYPGRCGITWPQTRRSCPGSCQLACSGS